MARSVLFASDAERNFHGPSLCTLNISDVYGGYIDTQALGCYGTLQLFLQALVFFSGFRNAQHRGLTFLFYSVGRRAAVVASS